MGRGEPLGSDCLSLISVQENVGSFKMLPGAQWCFWLPSCISLLGPRTVLHERGWDLLETSATELTGLCGDRYCLNEQVFLFLEANN